MTYMEMSTLEEAVRLRSYLIWEREGCPRGKECDHWRRAQEELEAELDHGGPPPLKATTVVMPRVRVSTRPNKIVSNRLALKKASAKASAATR